MYLMSNLMMKLKSVCFCHLLECFTFLCVYLVARSVIQRVTVTVTITGLRRHAVLQGMGAVLTVDPLFRLLQVSCCILPPFLFLFLKGDSFVSCLCIELFLVVEVGDTH